MVSECAEFKSTVRVSWTRCSSKWWALFITSCIITDARDMIVISSGPSSDEQFSHGLHLCWAEAPIKIARMTLTIKLDGNWSSFQLANSAPPLSVTDSAIAPSARILSKLLMQS